MEHSSKQKRVSFSAAEQGKYTAMGQNWNYDSEYAVSVAAAAFAVYSLEEAEAEHKRKITEQLENSKSGIRTRNESIRRNSFSKEVKNAGETSTRKPAERDQRLPENSAVMSSRKPSRSASMRPMISMDQRQRSNSTRRSVAEDKVDTWEKAQLRKINKRYEKMRSEIIAWENAKTIEAKLRMEKKKNELELRKSRNLQHYQLKVSRIEAVAGGANRQLDEKQRNEESEVKEKAKHMRSKGKNPVRFFCC
ncbi:remorin 1.4 isoform X2 [Mercurialis annua]|uniref:remorin 1.4 isoform X2 n=1 Tax=Mercurialis annua TaxID=3986 RepID=UPI002160F1D5|nr:remorin 1.4 isoform X2 [Mercurialis annua]